MSLKATGTHHAKRCEGPASEGKRVHFRGAERRFCVLGRRLFWRDPKPVRAAVRPKQNTRSPQGGGKGPKQCPGDAQSQGTEIQEEMVSTLTAAIADVQIRPNGFRISANVSDSRQSVSLDYFPDGNNRHEEVIIAADFSA
jgi:hypothetical protein